MIYLYIFVMFVIVGAFLVFMSDRVLDWLEDYWPFMTVKQHDKDIEITILVMDILQNRTQTLDFNWRLAPDLQPMRAKRLEAAEQAERDKHWQNVMAAVDSGLWNPPHDVN